MVTRWAGALTGDRVVVVTIVFDNCRSVAVTVAVVDVEIG
jgi:hypothetical protein